MPADWIWKPTPSQIQRTNVFRMMHRLGLESVTELRRYSVEHLETFWDEVMKEIGVEWFRPYSQVLDESRGPEWARWFVGGELNIAWNCLDRHASGPLANHPAILAEAEDGAFRALTFAGLRGDVDRLANVFRGLGLKKGDRVALILPMIPEVVTALYAAFKLGLIVVPIFSGFGAGAIATRLKDSGTTLAITADFIKRRGKTSPLKAKVDEAIELAGGVEHVLVVRYQGGEVPWREGRDQLVEPGAGGCAGRLRGDALRFRGPLLSHVHVGHHRKAERHRAHARRLPGADGQGDLPGLRPPAGRPVLLAFRHRLDDGPVGDYRQPPVRRHHLSCSTARPTTRRPTACGR